MATVVKHNKSGEEYVVLGTGYGAYKSSVPHPMFGNWMPDESEGSKSMIAVCNSEGEIGWTTTSQVTVISVDGKPLGEILSGQ